MTVEQAQYIKQLDPQYPEGGDSLSEGDDHIRLIKDAVKGSFPNIDSAVTATPAELNEVGNIKAELDALEAGAHGNVASCYFNPDFTGSVNGVTGLVYGHNIASVEAAGTPELPQTKVNFTDELPNMGVDYSHFAFNFSAVDSSGSPVILKVSSAGAKTVGFIAWKWLANDWVPIDGRKLAFTLVVVDMDSGQ